MQVAAFENEPDADATATMLREHGYHTEVVIESEKPYGDRVKDFFGGKPVPIHMRAMVITDAAGSEFLEAVRVHRGTIIRGDIGRGRG